MDSGAFDVDNTLQAVRGWLKELGGELRTLWPDSAGEA